MKNTFMAILLLSNIAIAQESQNADQAAKANEPTKKITTRDAKQICKEEGKTGAELLKCMKEKKDEK